MATYTPNYNLKKPALNDKIRIADFNGNADIIDGTMNDNATLIAQLKSDIGIVENTNTATHNISAGQYVIWKGSLYTASSAISSGATLSDANLTAVSGGGLNALNNNESFSIPLPSGYTWNYIRCRKNGIGLVYISGRIDLSTSTTNTTINLGSVVPAGYRPNGVGVIFTAFNNQSDKSIDGRIETDGKLIFYRPDNETLNNIAFSVLYPTW